MKLLRLLASLPRRLAIALIRVYQLTLSPMLGPTCRFSPSCSHYAQACLRDHGFLRGSWLTLRRLSRCHPFHPGGYDPPPPALGAHRCARALPTRESPAEPSSLASPFGEPQAVHEHEQQCTTPARM